MQAHLKNALVTTAIVLVTVYALRRLPVVGPFVNQAISG